MILNAVNTDITLGLIITIVGIIFSFGGAYSITKYQVNSIKDNQAKTDKTVKDNQVKADIAVREMTRKHDDFKDKITDDIHTMATKLTDDIHTMAINLKEVHTIITNNNKKN